MIQIVILNWDCTLILSRIFQFLLKFKLDNYCSFFLMALDDFAGNI